MKLENENEWDWLPTTNGSVIICAVKILVAITGELPGSLRLPPVKTQSTARTARRALPADNFFHIRVHPCPSVVKNVFLN